MARYWSDKQAIVTGGAGFLGQHVVTMLQSEGCGNIFVPHHREYDLTTEEAVQRMFSDAAHSRTKGEQAVVLHLAGMNGGIGANKARPAEFFYRNIMMNVLTIHFAWKTGAHKVVATGAGSGYPLSAPQPLKEDSLWSGYPQAETAPYALAKRMLDVQGRAYWSQYGLPVVTALLGNLYGPHDNFDPNTAPVISALVSNFVNAAEQGLPRVSPWGTGKSTRDFVYAADVAEGLLLAAEKYQQAEVVNLSAGTDTPIRQVVELIGELTNYTGEVVWDTTRPDGQAARRFDTSKALRDLGWYARTDLRSGLKLTIEWYRSQARAHTTPS